MVKTNRRQDKDNNGVGDVCEGSAFDADVDCDLDGIDLAVYADKADFISLKGFANALIAP